VIAPNDPFVCNDIFAFDANVVCDPAISDLLPASAGKEGRDRAARGGLFASAPASVFVGAQVDSFA